MSGSVDCSCTVLTPPGAGAIAVIRVHGSQTGSVVAALLRPKGWKPGENDPVPERCPIQCADTSWSSNPYTAGEPRGLKPAARNIGKRHAVASVPHRAEVRYARLVSGEELIDDVVVSWSPEEEPPAIDICAHGGVRVVERILEALERSGAPVQDRAAHSVSPWRAGNRIEDEALGMLATVKTGRAVRFLAAQRVCLDERLDTLSAVCLTDPVAARRAIAGLLDGYPAARRLVQGATVALIGPPNSGKSSLLNRLAGRQAATVSSRPGTTRDWVTADLEVGGVAITLVDTAGRHDAVGALERRGIGVGRRIDNEADVRILVLDGSVPLDTSAAAIEAALHLPSPLLVLANKSDLGHSWEPSEIHAIGKLEGTPVLRTSAITGAGVAKVPAHILRALKLEDFSDLSPCLFSARQARIAADVLSSLPADGGLASAAVRDQLIGP